MSAARPRVVVTGVGLVTALGDSLEEVYQALCSGTTAHRLRPAEEDGLPPLTVADLPDFDPRAHLGAANFRPLDRTARLAASAAGLALEDAGWSADDRGDVEIGLVLGTMFGSLSTISRFDRRALTAGPSYVKPFEFANSVINAAAGQTAIWHDLRGVNATLSGDTTSGLQALGYAADLVRNGHCRVVLAGGAEEICFESLWGFQRVGALCGGSAEGAGCPIPWHRRRDGFATGEGAVLLVLEEAAAASERGADIRAEIRGFATGFDGAAAADPGDADDGAIIATVVGQALAEAGLEPEAIGAVSASASGRSEGDRLEAEGLRAARVEAPVMAIKSMLGETLGMAGAAQTAALIAALGSGRLAGVAGLDEVEPGLALDVSAGTRSVEAQRGLVHALGFDGASAALVLETAPRGDESQ